jgi:hypothetical protein
LSAGRPAAETGNVTTTARAAIRERIDAIEAAYEFFLAYAAQGRVEDDGTGIGAEVRRFLGNAISAVREIPDALVSTYETEGGPVAAQLKAFHEVVALDARLAGASLELVAGLPSITSEVVDNLNANIHLRAFLTDMFLLDEVLAKEV